MRVKLDENVDVRIITRLRLAGHDVATVQGQNLSSAPDTEVITVCQQEKRCLVTADRGFGNRFRFNPSEYFGIVVVRLPARSTLENWLTATEALIQGLEKAEVEGKLWVIQQGKVQEYQSVEQQEAD